MFGKKKEVPRQNITEEQLSKLEKEQGIKKVKGTRGDINIEEESPEEDYTEDKADEEYEEISKEEDDNYIPTPSDVEQVPKPIQQKVPQRLQSVQEEEPKESIKPTLDEIIWSHESRLQAIESALFRIRGGI